MTSWYLKLAEDEGLDPKALLLKLLKAVHAQMEADSMSLHMGKAITTLRPLLSVKQVAEIFGRDEETIRRYARDRVLTAIHLPNGGIFFDPEILLKEMNQYLRASKYEPE